MAGSLTLVLDAPTPFPAARVELPRSSSLSGSDRTGEFVYAVGTTLMSAAVHGVFEVEGKRVLELGAGVHGTTGRALKQWFPTASVTLTDGAPGIVKTLRQFEGEGCEVAQLEWGTDQPQEFMGADLLIGCDIVYNPTFFQPLAETMASLLCAGQNEAWLAMESRDPRTLQMFKEEFARECHGLHLEFHRCSDAVWEHAMAWIDDIGPQNVLPSAIARGRQGFAPPRERVWLVHIVKQ